MERIFNVSYSDNKATVFLLDFEEIRNTDKISINVADTDKVEAEVTVKCQDRQAEEDFNNYSIAPVFEQGTLKFVPCGATDKIRTEYRVTIPNVPMIRIRALSSDINIRKYHGLLKVENASGNVNLFDCTLVDSSLENNSGDIFIEGTVVNGLDVATSSGNIYLAVKRKEDYKDRFNLTSIIATSRNGNIKIISKGVPVKKLLSVTGNVFVEKTAL